jgi:hypothetical protein
LTIKVKIRFMTSYVYDDSYFVELDELVLPFNDAKELVNNNIAVVDYIYN